MTATENKWVDTPGSFLGEELEERGWTQSDLAYILGVPVQAISMIVSGKRGISPEMAKALGAAFDVPAEFFSNLQKAYELSRAHEPSPDIAKKARLQNFPLREMIKRGWIEDAEASLVESQMASFFGVRHVDEIPCMPHAAKKTNSCEGLTPPQLAWLFRVKLMAREMLVDRYSEKKLKNAVDELAKLRSEPELVRHVPLVLSNAGVRFVIVEGLPKGKIDGVCLWLDKTSPVIAISLRYDRIDSFWFVLRHEIEHVLLKHGQVTPIVDSELEGERAGTGEGVIEEERLANMAAAEFCVPKKDMDSFYTRKFPYFSERDILGFAARLGVHPGLVVGQIQNRTQKYNFLRKHLKPIRKHILSSAVVDGWGEITHIDL